MEGLTVSGGHRGLIANGDTHLKLKDVDLRDAEQIGVLLRPGSHAHLRGTRVLDVRPEGNVGWGIAALEAELTMQGGGVYGATELGMFAEGGTVALSDIEIFDTQPSGRFDQLGRALHVQNGTHLTLSGGLFRNNADAGVFVLKGGSVIIDGLVIDITSAGIVIDLPGTGFTGDGIVVKQSDDVSIYDTLITDSARAGLLIDDSKVVVSGNAVDGSGLVINHTSQFAQENSDIQGDDADQVLRLRGELMMLDAEIPTQGLLED